VLELQRLDSAPTDAWTVDFEYRAVPSCSKQLAKPCPSSRGHRRSRMAVTHGLALNWAPQPHASIETTGAGYYTAQAKVAAVLGALSTHRLRHPCNGLWVRAHALSASLATAIPERSPCRWQRPAKAGWMPTTAPCSAGAGRGSAAHESPPSSALPRDAPRGGLLAGAAWQSEGPLVLADEQPYRKFTSTVQFVAAQLAAARAAAGSRMPNSPSPNLGGGRLRRWLRLHQALGRDSVREGTADAAGPGRATAANAVGSRPCWLPENKKTTNITKVSLITVLPLDHRRFRFPGPNHGSFTTFHQEVSTMALVPLWLLLDHAAENGYGIPAFNVNNLEQGSRSWRSANEKPTCARPSCRPSRGDAVSTPRELFSPPLKFCSRES